MGQPKGCIAWNKGKVGVQKAWNKGIPCRTETKEKLRLAKLGKPSGKKGFKCSPETIKKLKEASKRQTNKRGPKGKPWSLVRRQAQISRNGKPYKRSLHSGRPKGRRVFSSIIKNGKEYHPLWNEIRKLVYVRDKYKCQECGVHCHNTTKRRIQCHHIDYDILNNDLSNLITLCASCHVKTNFRRENWILYYRDKQKKGADI